MFDFVAAHRQQTAEFIKGDYGGGSAEPFVSVCLLLWRQALLSTLCPHFTKSLPARRHHHKVVYPKPDQTQPAPAFRSTDGLFLGEVKVRMKCMFSLCAGSFVKSLKLVLLLVLANLKWPNELMQKLISLPQKLSV